MWPETGNLMFPWRPDYVNANVCADDPLGRMVFVNHVSIDWLILPDSPGSPDALDALDRFLSYVDGRRAEGRVVYATSSQIADLAFPHRMEESGDTDSEPQKASSPRNPTAGIRAGREQENSPWRHGGRRGKAF